MAIKIDLKNTKAAQAWKWLVKTEASRRWQNPLRNSETYQSWAWIINRNWTNDDITKKNPTKEANHQTREILSRNFKKNRLGNVEMQNHKQLARHCRKLNRSNINYEFQYNIAVYKDTSKPGFHVLNRRKHFCPIQKQ